MAFQLAGSNRTSSPKAVCLTWLALSAGRNGNNAFVYAPAANSAAFQRQLYLTYLASSSGDGGPDGEVPEPGTRALIAVGIAGMGATVRNRRAA